MENKKRKILLVDDDSELREMYLEIFQNANFEVIEAVDGLDGLDKATKEMPDIIFTGIVMPRMDGFSMIEALKKTVMTSSIPIVISSHMGREEDKVRADALGVKDFIIRGTTRPIEVLERIGALFIDAGDSYQVEFNTEVLDAKKLAKELTIQESFNCLDCGAKLNLNLKLINPVDKIFEATFICSQCKSVVK